MNFPEAIASGFSNYLNFFGRAANSEYWFWVLFAALGMVATELLDAAIFVYHPGVSPAGPSPLNSPLNFIFTLVVLLPSLAVAVRRLHDIDRTGWWMLLVFTGAGILLLLFWQSQESTSGANRFGPARGPLQNLAHSR
jgi:uncharacterized membrane protein YhaH (DUF805 family)